MVVARLRAAGALILGTTNCPEFLMAYETANDSAWAHAQSVGPGALAGRIERRRVGGDCGGAFGCGTGQRQRRLGARAGALHRHLLAQAHAGPHSGPRTSAAVRGAVLDSRRDRAHGAHHRRCCSCSFARSSGQDPLDPSSPPVALREPSLDELRAQHNRLLRRRWPCAGDAGDARRRAGCGAGAARGRLSRGAVPAAHAGAAAQAVVEVLCAVRSHVLRAGDWRQGARS